MSSCDLASEWKFLHITTEQQQLCLLKIIGRNNYGGPARLEPLTKVLKRGTPLRLQVITWQLIHVEGGLDTWKCPQQVQVSGRTTHFDRVSDIACSNVEHLQRGTTHCDRVSDIA